MSPPEEKGVQTRTGQRTSTQITEEGFAAWNSGDCERFLANIHPEIVWKTAGLFPGLRSEYRGHDGMRKFWDEFQEPWEMLHIEAKRIVEPDDSSTLAQVGFDARGRDGIEVKRDFVNHMLIRDDLLYRYRGFADWETALAELGLEESDLEPAG
ncbi:MAG: nuclear transport factor 2 family protein [Solirubrobacterales bacterium]